jgi:thiosulfate/3-mercaptopyruvate sulfurtransferase
MQRFALFGAFVALGTLRSLTFATPAQEGMSRIPPVVSASWVSENLAHPNLIVVDLRNAKTYAAGHIPTSLSLPWNSTPLWKSTSDSETLVMPSKSVIKLAIEANGLLTSRWVVFVTNATAIPSDVAMATRSAITLRYVGFPIGSVAILDGGFPAWLAAGFAVSVESGMPRPCTFDGTPNGSFIVDHEYVRMRRGRAAEGIVILDTRTKVDFNAGHIDTALSLPAGTIWKQGAVWKNAEELRALFSAAVGGSPVSKTKGEILVYCWVGMLATTWVYALTSILGFENVKLYDGSYEDWTKYYDVVPSVVR